MSPNTKTFITWQELYRVRPKFDEVKESLGKLDRTQTSLLLSQISIHLALDRFHNDSSETIKLQGFLAMNLFAPDLRSDIENNYAHERMDKRVCVHPWQVLTLLKWALLECPGTGGIDPDSNEEGRHSLGRCLVKTNDLLMSLRGKDAISRSRKSEKRRLLALQLQLGSAYELNNPPSITSMVRTDMMFGEVARKVSPRLDVKAAFNKKTRLELDTYVDMVFALLTYYLVQSQQDLIADPTKLLFNPKTFFKTAPTDDVNRFLSLELGSIEDAAAQLGRPSKLKPQHDFIAFRRKPLLQLAETSAICLYPGFLQEKLESGLFWSIFNSLSTPDERDQLFSTWGMLFQEYVSSVISESLEDKSERYIPFPKFLDTHDESFDGIVSAGDKLLVMEYKGGFLKAEAKYGEDEEELIRDLRSKFGTGKRAGIGQLARKIGQVFHANGSRRREVENVNCSLARTIVPVMIVQEPFVSSQLTSTYLCGEFRSALRLQAVAKHVVCTGLQILDVSEIEAFRPYLYSGQCSFADCLLGRARLGDKAPVFHEYFASYFRQKNLTPTRDTDTLDRARQILDRISMRFFGHPLNSSL